MLAAQAPYGALLTAMVTPFRADGSVDLDAAARVATYLVDHGSEGLVVSGTTGESPTLGVEENADLWRAVVDAVGSRASVVAGVGTNATAHSVELAQQARKAAADAVLLVTPYYNKPSQAGLMQHFTTVADAAELPVILYDVPGRTGTTIAVETYAGLAGDDRFVAVKDATGNLARAARLVDLGYAVYSGDDAATLGFLAHGACGLVSVVSHAAGRVLAEMISDFVAGRHDKALAAYTRLLPVFDAVMGVPNYGATTAKACLHLAGVLDNRRVRQPLVALTDDEVDALHSALAGAGLL